MAQREHELLFRINAQLNSAYQATFREATAAMGSLREEYNNLADVAKDISAYQRQAQAVENTKAKLELLQQQYANIQREISETEGFSSALENKLAAKGAQIDKTTAALQNQTDKLSQYEAALQQAGVDTTDLTGESKRLELEMDNLQKSFVESSESAEEFGESGTGAVSELSQALTGAGVVAAMAKVGAYFREAADAAREFEAGMAAVRRTVGGSEEEIAALGDEFQQMAAIMPITTSELAEIATTAGQLGIAQENVVGFTRVMAELATTTDLSADSAATLLAQFANITGVTDYDRLGATVAALGDSTATTASKIVDMSQRLAAAATVAGISAQEVLGISAAVGALGARGQMGGTAMAQLITKLQLAVEAGEGLEDYAQAAGMTAQEFKRAWGEDAAGALNTFIQGLNDTERNGKSAIAMLDELGFRNARQLQVFTGLAENSNLLTQSLELANQSWAENTALTEKAGIMYDTNQARLTMMQNEYKNLKIAIGDQFSPVLANYYTILGKVSGALTRFTEDHPEAAKAMTTMTAGLAVATGGIVAYEAATIAASAAATLFKGTIDPLGFALTAVGLGLGALVLSSEQAEDSFREMSEAIAAADRTTREANAAIEKTRKESTASAQAALAYVGILERLEEEGTATTTAQEQYAAILEEINGLIPGINAQINEQTGLVQGGTTALKEKAEAWKQEAVMQAIMEAETETMKAYGRIQAELIDSEIERYAIEEKGADILKDITAAESALEDDRKRLRDMTEDSFESVDDYYIQMDLLNGSIRQQQEELDELYQDQRRNQDELDAVNFAIEEGNAALMQYDAAIASSTDRMSIAAEINQTGAESFSDISFEVKATMDALDALSTAYEEEYAKCLEVIQNQFGLWEEAPDITAESVSDMQKALDSQTSYWEVYSENLESLSHRNIEGLADLVKAMGDGTTKGAGYIAALNAASDEEIGGIIKSWEALQKAQGKAADEVEGVKSEFDTQIDALSDRMRDAAKEMEASDEARESAKRTVESYINAASYLLPQVQAAYQRIAQSAMDALRYANMTVITRHGENIGRVGYAEGTDDATPGVHLVGEQGPELVWFNGGERVTPAAKTVELLSAATQAAPINVRMSSTYNISGVKDSTDLRQALEEHDRDLSDKVLRIISEAERDRIRRSYY